MRASANTAAALLAAGAMVGVGCGGGGGGGAKRDASTPPSGARQPSPKRPIASELQPFNRVIATQSCQNFVRLRFSVVRQRPPGAPASAAECRTKDLNLQGLRGFRFSAAHAYGTAALMEAPKTAKIREYAIWVLDGDGRFRFTGESGADKPEIGSPFRRSVEASAVATGFIAAVRRGDCRVMQSLFSVRGRLAVTQGSLAGACRAVLRGHFFAPAVRTSQRTTVSVMGGTKDLAFVGVSTRRIWFTLLLTAQRPAALRVLDVLPSTRVALPSG